MFTLNNVQYADATVAQNLINFFTNTQTLEAEREQALQYLNVVLEHSTSVQTIIKHNMFDVMSVLFADSECEYVWDNFKTFCSANNLEYDTYKVF